MRHICDSARCKESWRSSFPIGLFKVGVVGPEIAPEMCAADQNGGFNPERDSSPLSAAEDPF